MQFARILRTAGLPVGPGQVIEILRAAEAVGIGTREDFYWALFARLRFASPEVRPRRFRPDQPGHRPDQRATMRATLRSGGDLVPRRFRTPRWQPPPLVILCDISGSMGRYSRLLLHFVHALT